MTVAYTVLAVLLALALIGSAAGKLTAQPKIVESLTSVGVPRNWYTPLAAVEIAGAIGLLAGIFYPPLGVAAAIGVVLYFLGAVIAHVRAKQIAGIGGAAGLLTLSAVVLGVVATTA